MSTLETILTRMMQDPAFADAIFTDTEQTLAEYSLTAEEIANIKELSRAQFNAMALNPEDRKSFAFHSGGGSGAGKVSLNDLHF